MDLPLAPSQLSTRTRVHVGEHVETAVRGRVLGVKEEREGSAFLTILTSDEDFFLA